MRTTTMEPPALLGLPLAEPDPVPDCRECQAAASGRTKARRAGDMSRVSDCNVQLRSHPHGPREQK